MAAEDSAAVAEVRAVLGRVSSGSRGTELLAEYLHRLNDHWGGLHPAHLLALAGELGLSLEEVRAAVGGRQFTVLREGEQAPAVTVHVCDSLACRMAGAGGLLEGLPALVGAGVAVVRAPCLGRCEQAPAALVGQVAVPRASPEAVLNTLLHECTRPAGQMGLAGGSPDAIDYATYRAQGGYVQAMAVANGSADLDRVTAAIAARWEAARAYPAPRRMVVNLAQAAPGAFQARACLERDPHRLLEGMLIAAQATGMAGITIFLRDDFHDARVLLQQELLRLRSNPPFPLPLIELRRGECLVGGQPALVHDFETLYGLRELLERGRDWFDGHGRRRRKGLLSIAVSGRVRSPGVKLAPAGISLRELVEELCDGMQEGHQLYAYLPGGGAGGILPAHLADLPLGFHTLEPYGAAFGPEAVVVLGQDDPAREAARDSLLLAAADIRGRCAACRAGCAEAAQLMEAPQLDLQAVQGVVDALADACACGHGATPPSALRCLQQYFPHELASNGGT